MVLYIIAHYFEFILSVFFPYTIEFVYESEYYHRSLSQGSKVIHQPSAAVIERDYMICLPGLTSLRNDTRRSVAKQVSRGDCVNLNQYI